ncbi:uncharacterized protein F54H12.2, partial [Nephila pilipes]
MGATNSGYLNRYNMCKESKLIDMLGALHFDLGSQSKCLINSVNLRIKLERNKDSFALMSAVQDYKIVIQHASLFVRKVKVAPSVVIAHEIALGKGVIKMPIRRTEVKSFALSAGMQSITIPNAFIGQLPTRLIMGMVSNTAFNGDFSKNPFNFKHYDLSYLCTIDGNRMIPSKPFQPKFDNDDSYSRCYMNLFTDLGRYHNDQDINISFSEYKDGYTLFAVDLTPDLSADAMHDSILRNAAATMTPEPRFGFMYLKRTVSSNAYTIHCFSDSLYENMISCVQAANVYQLDEIDEVGHLLVLLCSFGITYSCNGNRFPYILENLETTVKKRKFNIDLSKETDRAEKSPTIPFNVYIGKGVCLELKDFRKTLYLGFVKTNEKNEIKNRFNLHVDQIPVLIEAIEHIRNHLKS